VLVRFAIERYRLSKLYLDRDVGVTAGRRKSTAGGMSGPHNCPSRCRTRRTTSARISRGPSNQAALRLIESWPDWPHR
jgi:hypothetical protein